MKKDPIVEKSVKFLRKRSKVGIKKYGTTLKENNQDDFLQHLAEELGDSLNYIMKLKAMMSEYKSDDDFIDKIIRHHIPNTTGRESREEMFRLGVKAALNEVKHINYDFITK